MIQIDKTDLLYKTLQNLGVAEDELDKQYINFASDGIITAKDFNNYLQAKLGMDYVGDVDEQQLESIVDYYGDLKSCTKPAKNKVVGMLKQYAQQPNAQLRNDIISSQLKEVLLIACAYKLQHADANLNDLVQVCNIGLINAVEKYNVTTKLAFDTYLHYWIWDAINKENTLGE